MIIVDYYDHPPAKPFCDEHIQESTLDHAKVLEIAKARHASLVISLCLDQPLVIASAVSEELGLPSLLSAHTARVVTDKGLMKQVMLENGLPTSRFMIASDDLRSMEVDLNFPVVVKPVDGTGSQGVKKAKDIDQAEVYRKEAEALSKSGRAIIEEWCDGEELNVHCLVVNGHPHILLIAKKRISFKEAIDGNLFLGSVSCADLNTDQAALEELVANIARAFDIRNSPLLVQLFHKNGSFSIIEIAARIGGGMGQQLVELATGCDLIDASIDLLLGNKPTLNHQVGRELVYGSIILYATSGVFGKVTGLEAAQQDGRIHSHYSYIASGKRVPEGLSSKNRVGAVLISAASAKALDKIAIQVIDGIDILDQEGRSMFDRELYRNEF